MLQKWLAKKAQLQRENLKKEGLRTYANPAISKVWVGGNRAGA